MAYYLDSSAVVKHYVTEPGSSWVRQRVEADEAVILSEITIAEAAAALGIVLTMGRISPRRRRDFWERFERDCAERYDLAPVLHEVTYAAAEFGSRHPLRAYDALQLATSLSLRAPLAAQGTPLVFVSADEALVTAAQSEGLAVNNPFWHTDLDARDG